MSIVIFLAVCAVAFLLGMLAGISEKKVKPQPSAIRFINHREDLSSFAISNLEYENFLNYDGTEQN